MSAFFYIRLSLDQLGARPTFVAQEVMDQPLKTVEAVRVMQVALVAQMV